MRPISGLSSCAARSRINRCARSAARRFTRIWTTWSPNLSTLAGGRMPELPEVETIVADLRPHLAGRTIVRCELRFPSIVRYPEPEAFADSITGLRIEAVGRRGKFILIALGAGRLLVVHLGMSGQLRLLDAASEIAKHTHAILDLDDGKQLRYRDPRRFGRLLLGTEDELLLSGTLPKLGPEPIDPTFDAEELFKRFRRRRAPLKAEIV